MFDKIKQVKAVMVATLSAASLACTLLAQFYPIPCAIVGLWIVAYAASVDLHFFTPASVPTQVNIESAPNMTQNVAAPAPDAANPPPSPPEPIIGKRVVKP